MNLTRIERISAVLLLIAPILLANIARAEPPGRGQGRHRGPPPLERVLEKHADRLKLDETTLAQVSELAKASRTQSRESREQIHTIEREIRKLLEKERPDEAAIMERVGALGELKTAEHKHRLRSMLQIRALLTPEQREELVRIREENRPRGGRRPPPGGPPHDGPPPDGPPPFEER
ncbi:MAG: periplasmic heavy metal sensor [bacterium]|nr:periplasmic heavy metal sensor [bacterium]